MKVVSAFSALQRRKPVERYAALEYSLVVVETHAPIPKMIIATAEPVEGRAKTASDVAVDPAQIFSMTRKIVAGAESSAKRDKPAAKAHAST